MIITHDERFMEMIGKTEHTQYIWRVNKDEDGFSHLNREAVSDLYENE